MSDNISEELVEYILARVTAEDIVRCTAVCKRWYSLIRSPNFIHLHLNRSQEDETRNHVLLRYCTKEPCKEHYSLRMEGTFDEYKKFNFPFWSGEDNFRVVGSCNGLVCISDDKWSYNHVNFIWNPAIRKVIIVPRPNFTYQSHGPFIYSLGFGFDSDTNDYKIVRIVQLDFFKVNPILPEVEVYSLNSGCWRIISGKTPNYMIKELSQPAYVRGAAHWLARTTRQCDKRQNLISVFDMKDEIFREMLVPESLLRFDCYLLLHEYQESISLFHLFTGLNPKPFCTMWMMKEYGKPESWVKRFTINLIGGLRSPVGVRPNGEVLFIKRGNLLSYDYKDNKFSDLAIKGSGSRRWTEFFVGAYTESLALLDKGAEFYDVVISEKYCEGDKKQRNEEDQKGG